MKLFIMLASLVSCTALAAPSSKIDTYKVDPGHSAVVFKISHLGFSNTFGMFGDIQGKFSIDEADPTKNSIELMIKTDSITTLNAKRDDHLRKADFFNAKQFPNITFKSTSIKKAGADKLDVTGDLNLHGITKPVSFQLTRFRTGEDPWKSIRTGGEASFKIKRSDFGINYMNGENQIGDVVDITVSLEGIRE